MSSQLAVGAADPVLAVWDRTLRVGAEAVDVRLAPRPDRLDPVAR